MSFDIKLKTFGSKFNLYDIKPKILKVDSVLEWFQPIRYRGNNYLQKTFCAYLIIYINPLWFELIEKDC